MYCNRNPCGHFERDQSPNWKRPFRNICPQSNKVSQKYLENVLRNAFDGWTNKLVCTKVTVDLASHWPNVTDFVVYLSIGSWPE